MVDRIGGQIAFSVFLIFAMAADVLSASARHTYFTVYEILFGLGTVIGGWAFGQLARLNAIYPFLFSVLLSILVLLVAWIMLESLPPAKRKAKLGLRSSNTVVALSTLVCYTAGPGDGTGPGVGGAHSDTTAQLRILSAVFALLNLCFYIWMYASFLFLRLQLGFSAAEIGTFTALQNVLRPLVPLLQLKLKHLIDRDLHTRCVTMGLWMLVLTVAVGFTPFLVHRWALDSVAVAVGTATLVPFGFSRALVSSVVPADQQAFVMAGLSGVQTSCVMAAPVLADYLFSMKPVYPFLLAAGCGGLGAGLSATMLFYDRLPSSNDLSSNDYHSMEGFLQSHA